MIIRNAQEHDLAGIMQVEQDAFIPSIRENKETFFRRLKMYPQGFFVMQDEYPHDVIGYYCSELWDSVPEDASYFTLGHSAEASHKKEGHVLYISSVALLGRCAGKHLGGKLFSYCTRMLLENSPRITELVLLVNDVWKCARHLYEKNSFVQYGRLAGFFASEDGSCTDGILMKTAGEDFLQVCRQTGEHS